MTTIAARWSPISKQLEIASDGFVAGGIGKVGPKWVETYVFNGDRTIVMLSGDWDQIAPVLRFLTATNKPNPDENLVPFDTDKARVYSFTLGNGFEYWAKSHQFRMPTYKNLHSQGSGREYAMGALEMGATPREAVAIACKYDEGSKPPIRSKIYSFK